MTDPDWITATFAAAIALLMVVLWWPDGPETVVYRRLAEGDNTPDIFIGIPDKVVARFIAYESDADYAPQDSEFLEFAEQVRQSARITLERRRARQ